MPSLPLVFAVGNFAVGFAAFVAVGVLTPIAARFRIAPDVAGHVMTVYALAYAVGSPLLLAATGQLPRRTVLAGGLGLLAVGSLAAALAPSFDLLLAARAATALGASIFTPTAAAVAVAVTPPEHRARALATAFAGLTAAQALGVPAGAWIGYTFGWHTAFALAAILAGLSAALIAWTVPRDVTFEPADLATLARSLGEPRLLFAVSSTATFLASTFAVYTYLAPLLEARLGVGRDGVSFYLLVFGVAAFFGNFAGGALADRIGPWRTLLLLALANLAFLAALPAPLWGHAALAVIIAGWSAAGSAFMSPQQARLVGIAPGDRPIVLGLNASCIYAGIALGSVLGGIAFSLGGFRSLGLTGTLIALAALVHLALSNRIAPIVSTRKQ